MASKEFQYEIDILNREEFIQTILRTIEYYSNNNQNISFSIQGEWGCGKSWILDRVFENLYDMQDENIAGGRYCVFKYNAWKYDYYNEPLVSLLISLKEQFDSENSIFFKSPKAQENYKAAKLMIKEKILDCVDVIQESPLFEIIDSKVFHIPKLLCTGAKIKKEFEKYKEEIKDEIRNYDPHYDLNELMNSLVSGLNKICNNEKKTVVVIVDELDRCLPEHAIKVLERMHHISQNVDNIQFMYGIDKTQIEKNIVQIFNISKVDEVQEKDRIKKYLSKFISFGLKVPKSEYSDKFAEKYSKLFEPFAQVNTCSFELMEKIKIIIPNVTARMLEQVIDRIILSNSIINTHNEKLDNSILIFELFYAVTKEHEFDWKNTRIISDESKSTITLSNSIHHSIMINVFNRLISPNPVNNYGYLRSSDKIKLATGYEENKLNALCESALAFYYEGINKRDSFYFDYNDVIEPMNKNLEYINNFCDYYNSLEM